MAEYPIEDVSQNKWQGKEVVVDVDGECIEPVGHALVMRKKVSGPLYPGCGCGSDCACK